MGRKIFRSPVNSNQVSKEQLKARDVGDLNLANKGQKNALRKEFVPDANHTPLNLNSQKEQLLQEDKTTLEKKKVSKFVSIP